MLEKLLFLRQSYVVMINLNIYYAKRKNFSNFKA